ncbi:hypothetical protein GQ44DRAFT_710167 [Phaeosphaeriaceae sp. PMI808]|nr:hypothetical protein GQ44DRAFT_710167 [Phaeosphaeriaceae sp. PMI808]
MTGYTYGPRIAEPFYRGHRCIPGGAIEIPVKNLSQAMQNLQQRVQTLQSDLSERELKTRNNDTVVSHKGESSAESVNPAHNTNTPRPNPSRDNSSVTANEVNSKNILFPGMCIAGNLCIERSNSQQAQTKLEAPPIPGLGATGIARPERPDIRQLDIIQREIQVRNREFQLSTLQTRLNDRELECRQREQTQDEREHRQDQREAALLARDNDAPNREERRIFRARVLEQASNGVMELMDLIAELENSQMD